jgi:hypothetical protein
MVENNLQKDLQDHANLNMLTHKKNDYGVLNRKNVVEMVLPESATVNFSRGGGYHGRYTIVVQYDELFWLTLGSYGSCSGCDAFANAKMQDRNWDGENSTEHLEEEVERMLRDAYAFENLRDADDYINKKNRHSSEYTDDYPRINNGKLVVKEDD